ncbi:MAG: AAA family ATPase [Veillonellaceae bacterium]|nr:AAA family ATPase [Veillonellaceae bacterium]
MYTKEIAAGIVIALTAFLVWQGINILPFIFFAAFIGAILYFNNMRQGGKSFAAPHKETTVSVVSLDDIGGQDVAKNELREALEFIKDVESIKRLGIRPLKGILLNGPPGTGKTLLAKAAAHYTDSVFLAASGSEFVEMYVGVGAKRIRQLFSQAKTIARKQGKQSAVIFIDEIEILGGKRGEANSHMEHEQTLNELLVQMDGLASDETVRLLIIAATNRPDMLDPALLRPGRFDRQVKVDLPDKKGRLQILALHTRNKPLAEDVCLEEIADATMGFSGAHLESLANEAAILALREDQHQILPHHLRSAIDKVIMGEKLDRLPSPEEKQRIAVHEIGHALLSEISKPGSVATINVASRSNALGYVRQTQENDIYLYTLDQLKKKIAVALAGAVAEELTLGNRSTGASNDFNQATELAKQIIQGGMSSLGIVSADSLPPELLHSTMSEILRDVENYVRSVLITQQETAAKILDILLDKESLTGDEFRNMLQINKPS